MRYGTWKVRTLCRASSLTAATRELARCKLDLVGVQEVSWDKRGTVRAGDCNFLPWKRKRKSSMGTRFFYTTEYHQQLEEKSSLVIGCHI
jgi:hypothetical protein